MKIFLRYFIAVFGLTLLSYKIFAQTAPNISYTPSTNVLTLGTAFTLSPGNSGGAVVSLAYGTGITLGSGASFLNNPYGMAVDPSGNVYVVNYGNNTISEYNSSGSFINNTFGSSAISNPSGLAFDASGNAYVLNYNRTNNGNGNTNGNAYVAQYTSSGTYVSTIVQGLGTANGITINASSNIYVAQGSNNGGNNTVSQFNTSGSLAFSTGSANTANPVAVAVDGSGNIYALDNTNKNVTKYNSTGSYQSTIITGLTNPNAIYTDGAGDIFVGDSGTGGTTGSVTVYNTAGTVLTSITGLTDPRGLVTDSKGNLYVSDYTNNTIKKYPKIGGYVLSGTLPAGLSFSSSTGVFSGTPTTSFAATTYTITAYNSSGNGSTTVTLSCPANLLAPSIDYSPSINVFTIGTAITLSPTITNGTPSSYAISPAILPAGLTFSTSTGIISGTPTAKSAAAVYTVTATNASGSNSATVSIACVLDDYWTGNKNNDWNTKQNWSANVVPGSTDLASIGVINYTGPDPVISVNTSAYYVTFGAANSASLTVNTGVTFTINNILTVNNNASPTLTGAGAINIAPGAALNVNGTGVLTTNLTGKFTLQSNATSSASVGQILTTSIAGTGADSIHVERYITGGVGYRAYRLLSSPVYVATVSPNNVYGINYLSNSIYITGAAGGGFNKTGNPTLYLYREDQIPVMSFTSGNFVGISKINNPTLYNYYVNGGSTNYNIPAGNGLMFFFRGNRAATTVAAQTVSTYTSAPTVTLSAYGILNAGQIIVHDWYTPASANLGYTGTGTGTNYAVRGFNLVGNPYASSIDWEQFNTTTTTSGIYGSNIANTIYEWNPATSTYATYQQGGASTNNGQRTIVSGEGFFVLATNTNPQLIFNESAKVSTQNTGLKLFMATKADVALVTNNNQHFRLQLALDSIQKDDIYIGFNDQASNNYVFNEDAPNKPGIGKVSLTSISNDNVTLAINKLPLPKLKQTIIKLNVGASTNGAYKLNMTEIKGIPELFEIWLMDLYKKDSLDIRHNYTYAFDVNTDTNSYGRNRFKLVIRQNKSLTVHLLNFTAAKVTDGAQLVWKTENEQNYTNFTIERSTDNGTTFNVLGGFSSGALGTYSFVDKKPAALNEYRLKLEDLNGTITYSKIVTLMYSDSNKKIADIIVYPNPASSFISLTVTLNAFNLASNSLTLQTPGTTTSSPTYGVKIINITGAVVKTETFSSVEWRTNVSNLSPGTYIIQVVNNDNNSLVGKSTFVKL